MDRYGRRWFPWSSAEEARREHEAAAARGDVVGTPASVAPFVGESEDAWAHWRPRPRSRSARSRGASQSRGPARTPAWAGNAVARARVGELVGALRSGRLPDPLDPQPLWRYAGGWAHGLDVCNLLGCGLADLEFRIEACRGETGSEMGPAGPWLETAAGLWVRARTGREGAPEIVRDAPPTRRQPAGYPTCEHGGW